MKKDLILASIGTIQSGLQMLVDAIEGEGIQDVKEMKAQVKDETEKAVKKATTPKESPDDEDGVELTQEFLENVKYNDLKKLASNMGIEGKGTREQIIDRILGTVDADTLEEAGVEDPAKVVDIGKARKAKAKSVEEDEEAEEDLEEAEEVKPQWVLELEAMSVEDLADLLTSVKLPAKGKKQALVDRAIAAVNDGTIVIDEEVEEEEVVEEPVKKKPAKRQTKKDKEVATTVEREELITDELVAIAESLLQEGEDFDSFDVELDQETLDVVNKFSGTELVLDDLTEADVRTVTEVAVCAMLLMTDSEGDLQDFEEAYQLPTEQWFCCGHELEETDAGAGMLCNVCGSIWE